MTYWAALLAQHLIQVLLLLRQQGLGRSRLPDPAVRCTLQHQQRCMLAAAAAAVNERALLAAAN
jgi:hypothetical protein